MKSRRTRAWLLVALMALWVPGAAGADEDSDAQALVAKVAAAIPKNAFTAKITLSSSDFAPRELQMNRKYVGNAHGSYLEVTAPDELEGIRFLFLERADGPDEQYIKVKASRSPVRVREAVRTQPFLGSAFYVSDLVLPEIENYTYKYLGKDVIGGRSVNLVEMTPKDPDQEVYGKTVLALDPKDLLILRREFYDKHGDKVKVWTIDKLEQIDGIWTLTGQEMEDLKNNTKSRLDISEIKYNAELPDVMFTPKYLTR